MTDPFGSIGLSGQDGTDGKMGSRGAVEVNIGIQSCFLCEYKCRVDSDLNYNKKCFQNLKDKLQNNASLPEHLVNKVPLPTKNPTEKFQNASWTPSSLAYPLDEFKPYVKILLDNAVKSLNIFNRQDVSSFLDFVKSNPLLV